MALSNRIPPGIKIEDLEQGTGEPVVAGDRVRIQTWGFLNNGESIDTDHESGNVIEFRIGDRNIIPGLERGVIGMRTGGERKLKISPHLAYGDVGIEGKIPPNAVLSYRVQLLARS